MFYTKQLSVILNTLSFECSEFTHYLVIKIGAKRRLAVNFRKTIRHLKITYRCCFIPLLISFETFFLDAAPYLAEICFSPSWKRNIFT